MYRLTELRRLTEAYLYGQQNARVCPMCGQVQKPLTAHALSKRIGGRSNNVIIQRLLAGYELSGRSIEVLSDFLDEHWPEDVAWPEGIVRNGLTKETPE